MLDVKLFREQMQQLMSTMTGTELAEFYILIDAAHDQAKEVLAGNTIFQNLAPLELSLVKSTLYKNHPLQLPAGDAKLDSGGNIWGCNRFEVLDKQWLWCIYYYLKYRNKKGAFGGAAGIIAMSNEATIAVAGDWGTGFWRDGDTPSCKVACQIMAKKPDYTIHIGDTYYSGTSDEMISNLKNIWPRGVKGTFAIPGNHEMLCGDNFYNQVLPDFCPEQNGVSYFALQNDYWLIIALDTAYYARGYMYTHGAIGDKEDAGPQIKWLEEEVLPQAGDRAIIILTHHQPMHLSGFKTTALFTSVNALLAKRQLQPACWYFGHEHHAAVYGGNTAMGFPSRCVGHGSVPCGISSDLADNTGCTVEWTEKELANDKEYPQRLLNGYAFLSLQQWALTEIFYAEDGTVRWTATMQMLVAKDRRTVPVQK